MTTQQAPPQNTTAKNPAMKSTASKGSPASDKLLAAILIRSQLHFHRELKETLQRINLHDKLNCVVVPDNSVYRGMLQRASAVLAWGSVSAETVEKLSSVRRRKGKAYRLQPPRGGFERKGIKVPYTVGGALGKRPEMDSLIAKMI